MSAIVIFGFQTGSYNLVLNWHNAEVDHLHSWPHHPVGLERRDVDVLKFTLHCALATALSNCHEREETGQTCLR